MAEDTKQDLVLEAVFAAARAIGKNLNYYDEILQQEREAGLINRATEASAQDWVRAALELWDRFMGK